MDYITVIGLLSVGFTLLTPVLTGFAYFLLETWKISCPESKLCLVVECQSALQLCKPFKKGR